MTLKEQKIQELLNEMTLEEKIAQLDMLSGRQFATQPEERHHCSVKPESEFMMKEFLEKHPDGVGVVHDTYSIPAVFNSIQKLLIENSRLGIPVIFTGEALHGITGLRGTVYPTSLTSAATFAPHLVEEMGKGIGAETRALGMHEILAPNLDVARDPRWGRTEETFGEDTLLCSRMGVAYVKGVQRGDVSRNDAAVCEPKHYCVHGMPEGGINAATARVGKREVESCYLPVFEAAIQEGGAYNVMASYNTVDGDPMVCSKEYLTDILKDRIGLKGCVRADWCGISCIGTSHYLTNNIKDSIRIAIANGLDLKGLDCDGKLFQDTIKELVLEGSLEEDRVNDAARRMLGVKYDLGLFENPYADETMYESVIRCEKHRNDSLQIAREGIVLLENKDDVLPLSKDITSIALIGPCSGSQKIGGYSSIPTGYTVASVYDEMKAYLGDGVTIKQCDGCGISKGESGPHFVDGQPHLTTEGERNIEDMIEQAVEMASACDIIVAVCGDNTVTSGEGRDRADLKLSESQPKLIEELAKLGKKLILVLENGKPVDLTAESESCDAICVAWFGGEHGAKAIVEVLFGEVNPSGKLPISFPYNVGSIPCYYSIFPGGGQKYYENDKIALYPFGYGKSYTTFEYKDMKVTQKGTCDFEVEVKVKNIGNKEGAEVVQLYINDMECSVVTPVKLLKGFKKVYLKAGAEEIVTFPVGYEELKIYSLDYKWLVEKGRFELMIGRSSVDTEFTEIIEVKEDVIM